MTIDISGLMDKELNFTSPHWRDGVIEPLIVRLADNDIGFTCTHRDDPTDNFICFVGPLGIDFDDDDAERWEDAKQFLIDSIKKGIWDVLDWEVIEPRDEFGLGGSPSCAFI